MGVLSAVNDACSLVDDLTEEARQELSQARTEYSETRSVPFGMP